MRQEESLRQEIHNALDPLVRPAPGLAAKAIERVHAEARRAPGHGRVRGLFQAAGLLAAAVLVAMVVIAIHQATHRSQAPEQIGGPTNGPAFGATGAGGQIAWLEGQTGLTGFDGNGHIVGTIQIPTALRSPDGSELYSPSGGKVDVYNAATGKPERSISRQGSGDVAALSPDGRFLVILGVRPSEVEVVDLTAERSAGHTRLGTAFPDAGPSFLLVSPRASTIYAFGDFWRHTAVAVLRFDGSTVRLQQQVIDGQQGHTAPNCDGMAPQNSVSGLPERLLPDGKTMVSFCPGDGLVSWFDLNDLRITAQVRVQEQNPFWLSPVFSPDGSMLYVQEPGTGRITAVDLQRHTIVRSAIVETPTAFNPLRWLADRLFPPAFAGGIPRSAAISRDGTYLYVTGGFGRPIGVGAVRLLDFHVSGQWSLEGGGSLWLSGDGRTLCVLDNGGIRLSILNVASGSVTTVKLSGPGYDFLALTI